MLLVYLILFTMIYGGPYRTASTCGAYYFLTILDDCSLVVWIYLNAKNSRLQVL